ncbi:MAG: orotidine-5'-phosphate decarboxylase [Gemmatimonadota bacterium]
MKAELIVALDFPDRVDALALVDRLGGDARFFKVGLELFTRAGPGVVEELRERGRRVFLDLKLHDIPHTVAGAARAAAEMGVGLLTVHASGGRRMIEAARSAVEGSETRVLGVTILTSLSAAELGESWNRQGVSPAEEVARLADLALAAGAHGVVASPEEAGELRDRMGPSGLIVTPGIRLAGDDVGDQVRTATPDAAVRAGADFLVVGRSITRASDPAAAYARVIEAMNQGVGVV